MWPAGAEHPNGDALTKASRLRVELTSKLGALNATITSLSLEPTTHAIELEQFKALAQLAELMKEG